MSQQAQREERVKRTTIKCLACGNRAEDIEEHHRHMAESAHPDKGETWVR